MNVIAVARRSTPRRTRASTRARSVTVRSSACLSEVSAACGSRSPRRSPASWRRPPSDTQRTSTAAMSAPSGPTSHHRTGGGGGGGGGARGGRAGGRSAGAGGREDVWSNGNEVMRSRQREPSPISCRCRRVDPGGYLRTALAEGCSGDAAARPSWRPVVGPPPRCRWPSPKVSLPPPDGDSDVSFGGASAPQAWARSAVTYSLETHCFGLAPGGRLSVVGVGALEVDGRPRSSPGHGSRGPRLDGRFSSRHPLENQGGVSSSGVIVRVHRRFTL